MQWVEQREIPVVVSKKFQASWLQENDRQGASGEIVFNCRIGTIKAPISWVSSTVQRSSSISGQQQHQQQCYVIAQL
eukprot:1159611-Pelagomonas_calceolata.AAC.9